MSEISTTLRWRGNDLFAGKVPVGFVHQHGHFGWYWSTEWHSDDSELMDTEAATREALEQVAREALQS